MHEQWGRQIRAARKAEGFQTQEDLAKALGVEQNTVSRWETGEHQPTDAMKFQICLLLDRSLDELFGWNSHILDVVKARADADALRADREAAA